MNRFVFRRIVCCCFLFFAAGPVAADEPATDGLRRHEFAAIRMGVPVRLVLYSSEVDRAEKAAAAALECFETLNGILSDYDSDSELSRVVRQSNEAFDRAGGEGPDGAVWIPVGDDLFEVLKASRHYAGISDGAFDITVGPLVRLWRRSRRQRALPKPRYLDRARERVGTRLWELDEPTHRVRLLKRGMRLDLGGIAKGYAIDRAFATIRRHGIEISLVDAGGDMRLGDAPPGGWKIGLDDPGGVTGRRPDETVYALENTALAASGDASQFVEIDGVRYAHLIDPETGLGLTRSFVVQVLAPTAMQADALASALSVLGPEKGLKLIETQDGVAARMILRNDGRTLQSENWDEKMKQ